MTVEGLQACVFDPQPRVREAGGQHRGNDKALYVLFQQPVLAFLLLSLDHL